MRSQDIHHSNTLDASIPMLVVGANNLVMQANAATHRLLGYPAGLDSARSAPFQGCGDGHRDRKEHLGNGYLSAFVVAAVVTLLGATVQAQDARIYGGLRLGSGGEVEADGGASDDLVTTLGGQGGFDYELIHHLSLGGELRFSRLNTERRDDADVDGDLFVDVVAKPKLFFNFGNNLELFGTVPVGVTFISLNHELGDQISAGPGTTLGLGAGATYFVTRTVAISAEAAYLWYWYNVEAEGLFGRDIESDQSVGQFTLFANVVLEL